MAGIVSELLSFAVKFYNYRIILVSDGEIGALNASVPLGCSRQQHVKRDSKLMSVVFELSLKLAAAYLTNHYNTFDC